MRELHQLQQMQDEAKESCMVFFRQLHSFLKVLSNNDLKGTRINGGFEWAFATLFKQDVHTFTRTMLLNLDQLEKHLSEEEFKELESFSAFKHMESIRESIQERAKHERENDRRVNDRTMQSKEGKVALSKELNAGLIVTECNIRPINDQVPFAEVQLIAQHSVLANEQHHSVQSEPIYDTHLLDKVDRNTTPDSTTMCHRGREIDQNAEKC
ncbi:hypothetical protein Tco_0872672 [Tanacetum coccineum]